MQLRVALQKGQVRLHVAHGILGRAEYPQGVEGDELGGDGDGAAVGVLPGNQIDAPVAQHLHPLRDGLGIAGRLQHQIRADAAEAPHPVDDRLRALLLEAVHLRRAEAARQIPPLGLIAAGDGHDVGNAQGGQIQHGEGAHRPQALHHRHLGLL